MASKARQLAQSASAPEGRKNIVTNGAMQVAQRGTSFSSNANMYTLDRMRRAGSSLSTAVFDVEQSTDSPDGFSNSYKVTTSTAEGSVGTADISYGLLQKIEAQDLQHLGYSTSSAKSVTVSFYVKSNTTGTYVLNLFNADNSRHVAKTYTISSANTWEYKTLTFAGDTTDGFNNDNGSGLELYFITGAGTDFTSGTLPATWEDYVAANFAVGQNVQLQNTLNATWQITGLQLEVGSVATEFEHRSYAEELALCQRYYQKLEGTTSNFESIAIGYNQQTSNHVGVLTLNVPLRSTGVALETTGTASDYVILHKSQVTNCSSLPAIYAYASIPQNDEITNITFTAATGSGLVQEGGSILSFTNSAGKTIALEDEL